MYVYNETNCIADKIRKRISKLKHLLDEMKLPLARETLSRCTEDFDEIWKNMSREKRTDFERIPKDIGLKKVLGKLLDLVRFVEVELNIIIMYRIVLDQNLQYMLIAFKSLFH